MSKSITTQVPAFEHDCDDCVFLGRFLDNDLYFCDFGVDYTVIARYSSVLADYISGTILVPYYDELAMAHHKAVEAGLIA